jgi:hypothetical protein
VRPKPSNNVHNRLSALPEGNNSGPLKHQDVEFACSIVGFVAGGSLGESSEHALESGYIGNPGK